MTRRVEEKAHALSPYVSTRKLVGFMGLPCGVSSSAYDSGRDAMEPPTPDPTRFEIIGTWKIGNGLIVSVRYPDCTTFEGRKLLVYAYMRRDDIETSATLDPHFYDSPQSPIARFAPTRQGFELAALVAGQL
jgi:hypothetical protein